MKSELKILNTLDNWMLLGDNQVKLRKWERQAIGKMEFKCRNEHRVLWWKWSQECAIVAEAFVVVWFQWMMKFANLRNRLQQQMDTARHHGRMIPGRWWWICWWWCQGLLKDACANLQIHAAKPKAVSKGLQCTGTRLSERLQKAIGFFDKCCLDQLLIERRQRWRGGRWTGDRWTGDRWTGDRWTGNRRRLDTCNQIRVILCRGKQRRWWGLGQLFHFGVDVALEQLKLSISAIVKKCWIETVEWIRWDDCWSKIEESSE